MSFKLGGDCRRLHNVLETEASNANCNIRQVSNYKCIVRAVQRCAWGKQSESMVDEYSNDG